MFRLLLSCLLLTAVATTTFADAPAQRLTTGTDVAVTIRSGRVIRGKIDDRSNSRYLWVMADVEGMRVGSRIPVSEIIHITGAPPVALPIPMVPWEPAPTGVLPEPPVPLLEPAALPPHSVEVFARAANWDQDPEDDGLRVSIIPRASDGSYVVAPGSISVSLTTYRGEWRSRVERTPFAERWGREITAEDFGPEGAVVELPFEQLELDQTQDRLLLPLGELQLRLNVSGVGTFDAHQADVVLRPFALTNDFQQMTIQPPWGP